MGDIEISKAMAEDDKLEVAAFVRSMVDAGQRDGLENKAVRWLRSDLHTGGAAEGGGSVDGEAAEMARKAIEFDERERALMGTIRKRQSPRETLPVRQP
jgi:hypothetical protein